MAKSWLSNFSFLGGGSKAKEQTESDSTMPTDAEVKAIVDENNRKQEELVSQIEAQNSAAEDPESGTRVELARYMDAFGDADGARWFAEGVAFHDAMALYAKSKDAEIALLKRKLASADSSELTPVSANDSRDGGRSNRSGMASRIRIAGESNDG